MTSKSERPEDNFFLQTQGIVPLKSEFKPQMKVLSRKPAKANGGTDGAMGQLSLDDDDEDDEDSNKDVLSPEERFQKAQQEKQEKQKAYEERRRQLFGKDEASSMSKPNSKTSSPRNQSRVKNSSESRPASAASNKTRQLFDPSESVKPEHLRPQRKEPTNGEVHPIREPRAPDGSGRGGFGFSPRGGHTM